MLTIMIAKTFQNMEFLIVVSEIKNEIFRATMLSWWDVRTNSSFIAIPQSETRFEWNQISTNQ